MILYQADNPIDGSVYTFTKRQIKLTAQQTRRSGLTQIHRAHGAVDMYAGQANPQNVTALNYQMRFFPREDRTNFDALRQALIFACGHGEPQNLYFRDDSGNIWVVTGKAVGVPAEVSVQTPIWQDVQMQWELPNPFLRLAHQPGQAVWGGLNVDNTPILWGQSSLAWGQSPNVYTLNAATFDLPVIQNPLGTQYTTDPTFAFFVPAGNTYGPAAPSPIGTQGGGSCITIVNLDVLRGGVPVQFSIYGTSLVANDQLFLELGTLNARLNGTRIWNRMFRPATQREWFVLRPGSNHLRIIVSGTPAASIGAVLSLIWYPKTLL